MATTRSVIGRGCLLLGLCAAGCRTVTDVAHETAVQDLHCPTEQVRTTLQDASYFVSPSHYLAIGCGRYIKYVCYPIGKASYKCFPDEPPVPHPIEGGVH